MDIRKFLGNIIRQKSAESSKRFIALLTFGLVAFVVIMYTTEGNVTLILDTLLLFILALLGIASWQAVKMEQTKNDKE